MMERNVLKEALETHLPAISPFFIADRASCVVSTAQEIGKHVHAGFHCRQALLSVLSLGSTPKDGMMEQTWVSHLAALTVYIQVENPVLLSCRVSSHTSVFSCV